MSVLSRYGEDFYGCTDRPPALPAPPPVSQFQAWFGTWQLTSQWESPVRQSYRSFLYIRNREGNLEVQQGDAKMSNVSISQNNLSYTAESDVQTVHVTLSRTGDTLQGRFRGEFKSSGNPFHGTYTGMRR